jgi:hypothetical protein
MSRAVLPLASNAAARAPRPRRRTARAKARHPESVWQGSHEKAVSDGATGASDGGEGACERDLIAVPRIVLSGQPQDVGHVSTGPSTTHACCTRSSIQRSFAPTARMSVRSTACGTISRGRSGIDSVHVVVEQDHVLRRTPVWRRRYESREIERARNREDPDTACKWDDLERTAPVGSFPGTAWGLHDMHGRSSSGSSTAGTRATTARQRMDKSGPRRPAGTARPHVVRGGSRYGAVDGARCISGNRSIPGYSINHFGFRVVCSSSIEGF